MKEIPGHPDYFADTDGNIWSKKSGELKKLKPADGGSGYLTVALAQNGKNTSYKLHPLILKTFVGSRPEGMEACHNNSIKTDNRIENLRWDTRKNNIEDRKILYPKKEKPPRIRKSERYMSGKLNPERAKVILWALYYGAMAIDLAHSFEVSHTAILKIKHKKSYAWIDSQHTFNKKGLVVGKEGNLAG